MVVVGFIKLGSFILVSGKDGVIYNFFLVGLLLIE